VADIHVPIRAGSDIAFLGGIIRYIIENQRHFRDYVVNYTNAPAIITEEFRDTEETRFLAMLRVFQSTSPMSVSSWVLALATPLSAGSALPTILNG
jgi:anaerobic selenocysteine-containing dehydrogenase